MATAAAYTLATEANDYHRYAADALPELRGRSVPEIIAAVERGLLTSSVQYLMRRYSIPEAELVRMLGVSPSTLRRRRRDGRLNAGESDRTVRLAGLYALAEATLGDPRAAAEWMHEPNRALGARSPVDFALTGIGAREVEDLLGRIACGVGA